MEGIWIRSQNKEVLILVKDMRVCEGTVCAPAQTNNESTIVTRLGTYATKERAAEVLDEIQKYIMQVGVQLSVSSGNDSIVYAGVYEMPTE